MAKGECWQKETCVYQHKGFDLAKENDSDDRDEQWKNRKIDGENDSQSRTDITYDNADNIHGEDFRREPD